MIFFGNLKHTLNTHPTNFVKVIRFVAIITKADGLAVAAMFLLVVVSQVLTP